MMKCFKPLKASLAFTLMLYGGVWTCCPPCRESGEGAAGLNPGTANRLVPLKPYSHKLKSALKKLLVGPFNENNV